MATVTSISICSNAALQLGKDSIASFEQGSDIARLCKSIYPIERDALLREFPWNCAIKRQVLAPMAAAPAFGYTAQFALPSDFLRLLAVGNYPIDSDHCLNFRIEGKRILTSGTQLPIEYIFRNEDESTWDSKLVELMTSRMLWKLAYPLTQSTSLRDTLSKEYEYLARAARSIDSQENPSPTLSDDYPLVYNR